MKNDKSLVELNAEIHNLTHSSYEGKHPEIFNSTEQNRIRDLVDKSIKLLKPGNNKKTILDYGAGSGNITKFLINRNNKVIAADVSLKFLKDLKNKYGENGLETILINGTDLKNIKSNSIDAIFTYSVLHHVPNYLDIVGEFARILKIGGILCIDHEVDESYWKYNSQYMKYLLNIDKKIANDHLTELGLISEPTVKGFIRLVVKGFSFRKISNYFKSMIISHRAKTGEDGDIHTYKNDHIMWSKIIDQLRNKCEIVDENAYLLCRETNRPKLWSKWNGRLIDMRYLIVKKVRI